MTVYRIKRHFINLVLILFVPIVATTGVGLWQASARAQSSISWWTTPVNLSRSGAATRPVVAVAPDGTLHAVWWNATQGELYARTTGITATTWITPSLIPDLFGSRSVDSLTGRETLVAPRMVRLVANAPGTLRALWVDSRDQLQSIELTDRGWGKPEVLGAGITAEAIALDSNNAAHAAYLTFVDAPAGIYYRTTKQTGWSSPQLVYSSAYFRAPDSQNAHVSVAANGQGNAVVAWDDPQLGQSVFAWTKDDGQTWSPPQVITGTETGRSTKPLVAYAPNNQFLLMWQDSSIGGCGFLQRRSTDGGQTWDEPERVLASLDRCTADWSFTPDANGKLWLIGHPGAESQSTNVGTVTAATWDGTRWSEPTDFALSFFDTATGRSVVLDCLDMAIGGQTAGLIGCDSVNDVWAVRNAAPIDSLTTGSSTAWKPLESLTTKTGASTAEDVPDVATDAQGNLYAVWSQADTGENFGTALYAGAWKEGRWSSIGKIGFSAASARDSQALGKAEQPAIAADNRGRVHLAWSGGTEGTILYSWAYARDVGTGQGWSTPQVVMKSNELGSWPDIAANPGNDNEIAILYAIPFNEQRGIYLAQSSDGGTTWLSPTLVFNAAAAGWDSVDKPQIAIDADRNLVHATWLRSGLPGTVGPSTIYYARSADGGQTWQEPIEVAAGAVDWPRIVVPASGQVYVAWNQAPTLSTNVEPNVKGQYSLDGGERWTAPAAIRGLDRVSGPIGLSSDGAGQIFISALGHSEGDESALLYSRWNGQTWSEVESSGLGQIARQGNNVALAVEPKSKQLNAVLHLWRLAADGSGQFSISTTDRPIPSGVSVTPAPTFTPPPKVASTATSTPAPTATPRPQLPNAEQLPPAGSSGPPPLLIGVILAALVVGLVAVGIVLRRPRN
jgi:hypothetical protein